MTAAAIRWRLTDGARLEEGGEDTLVLRKPDGSATAMQARSQAVRAALLGLNAAGIDEDDLAPLSLGSDDEPVVLYTLAVLRRSGFLVATVEIGGVAWATLVPTARRFSLPGNWRRVPPAPLSRFALLRADGGDMRLECTEAAAAFVLRDARAVTTVFALRSAPVDLADPARAFASLLSALGFATAEAEAPATEMWEFHDRLLFTRSRLLEDLRPFGPTFRFRDRHDEPAPQGRPYGGRRIPLPDGSRDSGASFRSLVMARRSRRIMGTKPVRLEDIAIIFDRVERARPAPSDLPGIIGAIRPRPSGGARYELDFYLAAGECEGLAPGLYRYDGNTHDLEEVGAGSVAAPMLAMAEDAWGHPGKPPQALIVVSARHPRLAYKYEKMAYRLSLLHAGIVLQMLYLTCTELGLHGCALGSMSQPLFERATGRSSFEEASIVEFGFGSPPND